MIDRNEEQIQSLIDRLEKLEIIGENVLKYWEKDKVQCILKIKNQDYKIKTAKIEATEKDREDYETHINDLLKLDVIRRSNSPYRSIAFLVNKHSEQKRGKSRMVINYKRLNDNTEDDGYDILTKELHKFLGVLNYARPFIKNLSRITGPRFSKVGSKEKKCIIDNLWISFSQIFNNQTNKSLDRKYFITCLNYLSEYFKKKNKGNVNFSFYVIYQGHKTCILNTWEEVIPYISNHPRPFFKGFYNITQTLDQCKTNLGSNYFVSPLVKQFLNHHGQPYLKPVEPCSSQTKTLDFIHDFPPFFPPLQNQDHLLREKLEILRKNMIDPNKTI